MKTVNNTTKKSWLMKVLSMVVVLSMIMLLNKESFALYVGPDMYGNTYQLNLYSSYATGETTSGNIDWACTVIVLAYRNDVCNADSITRPRSAYVSVHAPSNICTYAESQHIVNAGNGLLLTVNLP